MTSSLNNRHDPEISNMIDEQVMREFDRATMLNPAQSSMYEGYAIVLEELDGAWDNIKHNNYASALDGMVQVAAMAIRFCHDHVMRSEGG
tara:strand:- start:254 stop:523 length:270 start_codon:yes stop_codon:yes gene_type:complete